MKVIYAREELPDSWTKSIFLAGPTPRSKEVQSWRPEALKILQEKGYDGVVFVPEDRNKEADEDFDQEEQVHWEHRALNAADCILFWVPRRLDALPGFTTNIEFGLYAHLGKSVLGYPSDAVKMSYLNLVAKKFFIPVSDTLNSTIDLALRYLGNGVLRVGGEREIPLRIWRTRSFQSWYQAQKSVGNRLDGATLQWVKLVGKNREYVFSWAFQANVYIAKEKRNKTNEVLISRTDISSVVVYKREPDVMKSKIILVREFRTPASTPDGFIWEVPSGSSPLPSEDPFSVAAQELWEETGFRADPSRLKKHGSRQLAGTFTAHKSNLFSIAISDEELDWFLNQKGIVHGTDPDNPTGERTYVEVKTLGEILNEKLLDWSNIGMILSVVAQNNR